MRNIKQEMLDEVLDINGWDLKKALQHFHKGNAMLCLIEYQRLQRRSMMTEKVIGKP